MSRRLGFLDLPIEIRFMIYKLLFHPSPEPILVSFLLASSVKRSAQLLRTCRSCHEEASSVLYGKNLFALDWAYAGTEIAILDFLEDIGMKNRQLIRHLRALYASIETLDKMRARRSLRPILEGLDSLSLEFYIERRSGCTSPSRNESMKILKNLRRYIKAQRGPYQRLVRSLKSVSDCPAQACFWEVRLVSPAIKHSAKVVEVTILTDRSLTVPFRSLSWTSTLRSRAYGSAAKNNFFGTAALLELLCVHTPTQRRFPPVCRQLLSTGFSSVNSRYRRWRRFDRDRRDLPRSSSLWTISPNYRVVGR